MDHTEAQQDDYMNAWQRYRNMTYQDLPSDVVTIANQCMLDWFGCAFVGSKEPVAAILQKQFGHRSGTCSVVGSDLKLDAATAALLNGTSGHALDYDDTGAYTLCHTTAPVMPAVLAAAQEINASGAQMLTALVVGIEIAGRIARAMGTDHYARGWHSTATYGTFGATAGVCHLMGVDDDVYATAMGLAASHASGVKANFGTMTKPYHPGRAAENGINCAQLAAAGFTANPNAVLGNQGFVRAASNAKHRTPDQEEWMIRGTLFKYHAACHLTHSSIESVLQLKQQLAADELSALTITVNSSLLDVCGIPEPQTGLEGKFSLTGTASMALLDMDTSDPAMFVDEVIQGADLQALLSKIKVECDDSLDQFQSKVEWVDQQQVAHRVSNDLSEPVMDLSEQGRKLDKKFQSLCAMASQPAAPAYEALSKLAEQDRVEIPA